MLATSVACGLVGSHVLFLCCCVVLLTVVVFTDMEIRSHLRRTAACHVTQAFFLTLPGGLQLSTSDTCRWINSIVSLMWCYLGGVYDNESVMPMTLRKRWRNHRKVQTGAETEMKLMKQRQKRRALKKKLKRRLLGKGNSSDGSSSDDGSDDSDSDQADTPTAAPSASTRTSIGLDSDGDGTLDILEDTVIRGICGHVAAAVNEALNVRLPAGIEWVGLRHFSLGDVAPALSRLQVHANGRGFRLSCDLTLDSRLRVKLMCLLGKRMLSVPVVVCVKDLEVTARLCVTGQWCEASPFLKHIDIRSPVAPVVKVDIRPLGDSGLKLSKVPFLIQWIDSLINEYVCQFFVEQGVQLPLAEWFAAEMAQGHAQLQQCICTAREQLMRLHAKKPSLVGHLIIQRKLARFNVSEALWVVGNYADIWDRAGAIACALSARGDALPALVATMEASHKVNILGTPNASGLLGKGGGENVLGTEQGMISHCDDVYRYPIVYACLRTRELLRSLMVGTLHVTVVEARDLENKDVFGLSDPYCIVSVGSGLRNDEGRDGNGKGKKKWKSAIHYDTLAPQFDHRLSVTVQDLSAVSVTVDIFDYDKYSPDASLGSCTVQLQDAMLDNISPASLAAGEGVFDIDFWTQLRAINTGRVRLRLSFKPLKMQPLLS